jgi:hypothetical protein
LSPRKTQKQLRHKEGNRGEKLREGRLYPKNRGKKEREGRKAIMAAAAPPETALPAAAGPAYDGEEDDKEQCRICLFPAEADRPLRHPCACHGSIRFVHDDCQFRWMAIRRLQRCEVSIVSRLLLLWFPGPGRVFSPLSTPSLVPQVRSSRPPWATLHS